MISRPKQRHRLLSKGCSRGTALSLDCEEEETEVDHLALSPWNDRPRNGVAAAPGAALRCLKNRSSK